MFAFQITTLSLPTSWSTLGALFSPIGFQHFCAYFVLQYLNGGISDRNQKRAARAEQLKNASSTLREKLDFARTFAMKQEAIDQKNLAYTTEQDLADQEYAKMLKEQNKQ